MNSFECAACGEIISEARRAQHEELWCEAIISNDDIDKDKDKDRDDSGCEQQPVSMAVAVQDIGDLNTKVHKITDVQLSSGLELSFEEISVFTSDTSTGGALWKSELLLAEWALREVTEDTVVVELGCGACPAAGMAAASMGCGQSIMTDLPEVVKLAEVNLRRNLENISKARGMVQKMGESTQLSALPPPPPLGRNNFDTAVYEWGAAETNDILPERLSSLTAIDVILIGDCIFSKKIHMKLLQTITQLVYHQFNNNSHNTHTQPKVILAYQRREGTEEADFFRMAEQDFGLVPIPVDNASGLKAKLDGSTDGLEICQLVVSLLA